MMLCRIVFCAAVLGFLPVFAAPELVMSDRFCDPNPVWNSVRAYAPWSCITFSPEKGVVFSRNEKQPPVKGKLFDTAFELKSRIADLSRDAEKVELVLRLRGEGTLGGFSPSSAGAGYQSRLRWYDRQGKLMEKADSFFRPMLRKKGLSTVQFRFPVPKDAAKVSVELGFDTPDLKAGEKIIFRELRLTAGTAREMDALPDCGSRSHDPEILSGSPAADGAASVVFRLENPEVIRKESLRFFMDDREITGKVTAGNGVYTWKPESPLAEGVHILSAELTDTVDPEPVRYPAVLCIGKNSGKLKVTLRDDGMTLVNGKPFFILGIACVVRQGRNGRSYDRAFQELAEAGMNFSRQSSAFGPHSREWKEFSTAAAKHGIFLTASPIRKFQDLEYRHWAEELWQVRNAEQVIAWYIGDDTADWISAELLKQKHKAIRAVDPDRITTQADVTLDHSNTLKNSGFSRYAPYVGGSDSFQPEIYPVGSTRGKPETPEMTGKMVPCVIRDMKQIRADVRAGAKGPKSLWPLIQYFYFNPKRGIWSRMPTRQEIRAMSYLAVIHGSHGVFWYRYAGYPDTPNAARGFSDEEWENLKRVSLELRGLYDVLCARTGEQTQKVSVLSGPAKDGLGFESVNTLLKEWKGTKYLFVCNSAFRPVTAQFSVPGVRKVRDRFGKRDVPMTGNSFSVPLEPYDVKVFEIR